MAHGASSWQGSSGEQEYTAGTAPRAIFISHILGDSFWPVAGGCNPRTSPQITVGGCGPSERTQLWAPDPQRSWGRPTTPPPSRDGGNRGVGSPWPLGDVEANRGLHPGPPGPVRQLLPGTLSPASRGRATGTHVPWGEQGSPSSSGSIATLWQSTHLGYKLTHSPCHHPHPL